MMNSTPIRWLLVFLLLAVACSPAWAQRWGAGPRGAGWGGYRAGTVETVHGRVVSVERVQQGVMAGVHLRLRTEAGMLDVHLGPSWYVDNQPINFVAGDALVVTGSRCTYQGHPALLAATVHKGGHMLHLRNAQGVPAWRGRGRGRRY